MDVCGLGLYTLNGHTPVLCTDTVTWARWFEAADRQVARAQVGDATVSTVFLGINYNYGNQSPALFETMVFDGQYDGEMMRCATWEQAEKQHTDMVYKITAMETLH